MAERIYTEKEVTALLERAAELQVQAARHDDGRPGLTLPELETIAQEAGLDPALLRQAAQELDAPNRSLFDVPARASATHVYEERWVPGTLTMDEWEDIVAELRHRFDTDLAKAMGLPGYGVGTTEQIGRTLEWKHTSMSGIETRLMIRQQGEGLRLRMSQHLGWGSMMTEACTYGSFLALLPAFVAGAITKSPGIGVLVLLLALVATIPLIYYAEKTWRGNKHRALRELADQIALLATTDDARATDEQPLAASAARSPLLDASEPSSADAMEASAFPTRSTARRVR